jgi:FkbM family methyltransferase
MKFYTLLIAEILQNIANQYEDNYDYERFGLKKQGGKKWKLKIKSFVKQRLHIEETRLSVGQYQKSFQYLLPYMDGIKNMYDILEDEQSKYLLVQLIVYRILGCEKYKLPLSTPEYFTGRVYMEKLKCSSDALKTKFPGQDEFCLYKYDLNAINIPMQFYNTPSGIYDNMYVKQYEYVTEDVSIKIKDDDVVLDCGACWGETALFFANGLNEKGKVYSFEFIQGNINIFNKNMELNPNLKKKIILIPSPLDEFSNKKLYYTDLGPGSRVSTEPISGLITETISIDDFFEKYNLSKVDFIKMDIEGMELPALKGAIKTIKQFKPKLAISIYHSMNDFVNIIEYLKT